MEARLKEKETEHWVEVLNANDIPSGAILGLEAALKQPQIRHRESLKTVTAEGIGELPLFTVTAKFSKTPGRIDAPPPKLSAHTREILSSLGYSDADIEKLKQKNVI